LRVSGALEGCPKAKEYLMNPNPKEDGEDGRETVVFCPWAVPVGDLFGRRAGDQWSHVGDAVPHVLMRGVAYDATARQYDVDADAKYLSRSNVRDLS
jgi:hypothetical protein